MCCPINYMRNSNCNNRLCWRSCLSLALTAVKTSILVISTLTWANGTTYARSFNDPSGTYALTHFSSAGKHSSSVGAASVRANVATSPYYVSEGHHRTVAFRDQLNCGCEHADVLELHTKNKYRLRNRIMEFCCYSHLQLNHKYELRMWAMFVIEREFLSHPRKETPRTNALLLLRSRLSRGKFREMADDTTGAVKIECRTHRVCIWGIYDDAREIENDCVRKWFAWYTGMWIVH